MFSIDGVQPDEWPMITLCLFLSRAEVGCVETAKRMRLCYYMKWVEDGVEGAPVGAAILELFLDDLGLPCMTTSLWTGEGPVTCIYCSVGGLQVILQCSIWSQSSTSHSDLAAYIH